MHCCIGAAAKYKANWAEAVFLEKRRLFMNMVISKPWKKGHNRESQISSPLAVQCTKKLHPLFLGPLL